MAGIKSLWRPELFSTVGAGFTNDQTLQTGIHLRWRHDYRLGLPYERKGDMRGGFHVYVGRVGSLAAIDLFSDKPPFDTITHRYPLSGPDAGMTQTENTLRFWRRNHSPYRQVATLWANAWPQLTSWLWSLGKAERKIANHAKAVMERLVPAIESGSISKEYGELCAVDLLIQSGAAEAIALDRNGREVTRQTLQSGAPLARFRVPGIAAIRLEPIPGKPPAVIQAARWIFCEEYCQSHAIWDDAIQHTLRFVGDPDYHQPDVVKEVHYRPFTAGTNLDFQAVSEVITQELVGSLEVQTLLDQPWSWEMAEQRMAVAENADAGMNLGTTLSMPILQSLIAAGVDPVMARILNLYGYLDEVEADSVRGQDIKVEAVLPFFMPDNLHELNALLVSMVPSHPPATFFLETVKATQSILSETALCGLLLSPTIAQQPATPAPENFATWARVTDMPTQKDSTEKPAGAELFCEAELTVSKGNIVDTVPYLKPIAYLVERSLTGGPYVNTAAEGTDGDAFDELGIVPPVYFLQSKDDRENALIFRDDFVTGITPNQYVRYRLTAYDLFGRPSMPVESPIKRPIQVPNHPPKAPINLSAQVQEENGLLYMETYFSLDDAVAPLVAKGESLEVAIHRLPVDPGLPLPPEQVQWSDPIAARRLIIPFLADGSLNGAGIAQSCMKLSWNGTNLIRTSVAESACSVEFPAVVPQLASVDPLTLPHKETGYRTYRLRVAVANPVTLQADAHRWCIRLRVRGRVPGFAYLYSSKEPCVAGDWLVTPTPPLPVQPPLDQIPVSTYPDPFGNSYYAVDLNQYVNEGDLVNLYTARLDQLVTDIGTLVDGFQYEHVGAQEELIALARQSKQPFELLTQQPVECTAQNRFYPVHIPGDLRHYHVVAVVGANPYLQEHAWDQSGILLFTTPEALRLPTLQLVRVEPTIQKLSYGGLAVVNLEYRVPAAAIPDPTNPPLVQLQRRNLTA
ncbi:MAG: hypothetical protein KDE53_21860, partial [Caldilineaceae bacterium]|nr:hypothetical protein [Caldilineaceae bacterium]